MPDDRQEDRQFQIRSLAGEVMRLAHDGILINMRFLDVALSKLKTVCREQTGAHLFDGSTLYYDRHICFCSIRRHPIMLPDCICIRCCTASFITAGRRIR